ncbi:MAG: response regulator transcription factor [Bacteroidales bacterium]|jgi:DNA-binding NarL/FixJ family response regulator
MKIVIADDSSQLRDRIKGLLSSMKNVFVVGEAENGVDALRLIREKEPDLAIIDIRMPEMNGIDVLKKIRELKIKIKVCILTNYAYPIYRRMCFEAGTDYFLRKTEDFEEMEIIVSDMLLHNVEHNNKSE